MAVGNYATLDGTIDALNTLKTDLGTLKKTCDSRVLQRDTDDWSNVTKLIEELENDIDALEGECSGPAQSMESISKELTK